MTETSYNIVNTTLSRVLFTTKQHSTVPRMVWQTTAELLGNDYFALATLNKTISNEPFIQEIASIWTQRQIRHAFNRIRHNERVYNLLYSVNMTDFKTLPELKYSIVMKALHALSKIFTVPVEKRTILFAHGIYANVFKQWPSGRSITNNTHINQRHPFKKRIFTIIGILFVEMARRNGVSTHEIHHYVSFTTGYVWFLGKRNQRNYRAIDECIASIIDHPLLINTIHLIMSTGWGKFEYSSKFQKLLVSIQ